MSSDEHKAIIREHIDLGGRRPLTCMTAVSMLRLH